MKLQSVRGMNDVLEPQIFLWQAIESRIHDLYRQFGYVEIRTPIVEPTALFKRGVGEETDVVEKEMYTFEDRNGESLSLRPEGTAAVVRSMIEHNYLRENPVSKFYYIAPMFRHERPQKGRYRQFHQYGVELLGSPDASSDAEVIALHSLLYTDLGLKGVELRLSSIGCNDCRPAYRTLLSGLLEKELANLPEDFHKKIHTNPQRVFDLKNEGAKVVASKLPKVLDHLCENCRVHLNGLKNRLKDLGVPFELDPSIVRGLDYYNRTAFEFTSSHLGAQSAAGGGGRYDSLFENIGGKATPAVGYAGGMERLIMLLEDSNPAKRPRPIVYFVGVDEAGLQRCEPLCFELDAKACIARSSMRRNPSKLS